MEPRKSRLVVDTAILTAPGADDPERMIAISYILADLDVTHMTIWRWSRDPDSEIRFPAPDLVLSNKKRLWRLGVYRRWKGRLLARGRIDTPRGGHVKEGLTVVNT